MSWLKTRCISSFPDTAFSTLAADRSSFQGYTNYPMEKIFFNGQIMCQSDFNDGCYAREQSVNQSVRRFMGGW